MTTGKAIACVSLAMIAACCGHAARLDETFGGRTWYVSIHAPSGGNGTLRASLDGGEVAPVTAAQGETRLKLSNPNGNVPRTMRFAYAAAEGDEHGAMSSAICWDKGTFLILR